MYSNYDSNPPTGAAILSSFFKRDSHLTFYYSTTTDQLWWYSTFRPHSPFEGQSLCRLTQELDNLGDVLNSSSPTAGGSQIVHVVASRKQV